MTDETGGEVFQVADPTDLAEEYAKGAHEIRSTFSLAVIAFVPRPATLCRRTNEELPSLPID